MPKDTEILQTIEEEPVYWEQNRGLRRYYVMRGMRAQYLPTPIVRRLIQKDVVHEDVSSPYRIHANSGNRYPQAVASRQRVAERYPAMAAQAEKWPHDHAEKHRQAALKGHRKS